MENLDDYQGQMKGKLKSYLGCIPDVVAFDLDPTRDDFILLSTDGILQTMPIQQVVNTLPNIDRLHHRQIPSTGGGRKPQ